MSGTLVSLNTVWVVRKPHMRYAIGILAQAEGNTKIMLIFMSELLHDEQDTVRRAILYAYRACFFFFLFFLSSKVNK